MFFVEFALVIAILATILYLEPQGALVIGSIFGVLGFFFLQLSKKKLKVWGEEREVLDGKILKTLPIASQELKRLNCFTKKPILDVLKRKQLKKGKVSSNFQTLSQIPRFYLELITIIGMVGLILVLF